MSDSKKNPMIGETVKDIIYGNPMVIVFESGDRAEFEFCNVDGKSAALIGYKTSKDMEKL